MQTTVAPTKTEVFFHEPEIIVSKTDVKGRLTYINQTFCNIAGYTEAELIGKPHSCIRHPDMPRAVFELLWDSLLAGREIFAYVKNITKFGDYYWVFAHVTPSHDEKHNVIGFHPSAGAVRSASIVHRSAKTGSCARSRSLPKKRIRIVLSEHKN